MFQAWSKTITRFTNSIDPNSMQTRLTAGVLLACSVGHWRHGSLWMGWRMQQILLESHRQRTALVAARFRGRRAHLTAPMMPPASSVCKK
jgi:hypothetical protein